MEIEKNPAQLRKKMRAETFVAPTCGQAPGYVQANLVSVPQAYAFEFLLFCQRNPKPCPLLEVVEAGAVEPRKMAPGADLRTDLPRYRVFREGEFTEELTDVRGVWQDDFVSFLLGCSLSFEQPLVDAGLEVRHLSQGTNVPMYRTEVPCYGSGRFQGPLVVSMRPFTPENIPRVVQITAALPEVHGAPVHFGHPEQLGIKDLSRPDYGDPSAVNPGETPVFWACGVTPQAVLLQAEIPLAITHAPGHMFVTDLPEKQLPGMRENVRQAS